MCHRPICIQQLFLVGLKTAHTAYKLKYSITCIQRPSKENNKSGLLLQVVFKYKLC